VTMAYRTARRARSPYRLRARWAVSKTMAGIYAAGVDLAMARRAVRDAAERVSTLFESLPDPGIRARGSDWTASEVAAHLVLIGRSYDQYLSGDTTPVVHALTLNADNLRTVATTTERDVGVLMSELQSATDRVLTKTEPMSADAAMPWHGVTAAVGSIYGVWLGELLVHGWDVARAARRRWPISRDEAAMIVEGAAMISPHFVDCERAGGLRATFEVRLRGGPTLALRFDDGALVVTSGPAPDADCRMSGDARAVMFVTYHRKSQWGQIALGRLIAYGRKPWLGLRFADLFGGF
jgi:hypothetical protein